MMSIFGFGGCDISDNPEILVTIVLSCSLIGCVFCKYNDYYENFL